MLGNEARNIGHWYEVAVVSPYKYQFQVVLRLMERNLTAHNEYLLPQEVRSDTPA